MDGRGGVAPRARVAARTVALVATLALVLCTHAAGAIYIERGSSLRGPGAPAAMASVGAPWSTFQPVAGRTSGDAAPATTPVVPAPGWVSVQPCASPEQPSPQQQWLVDSDGLFKSAANPLLCLSAKTVAGELGDGTALVTSPCRPAAALVQSFARLQDGHLITTSDTSMCIKIGTPSPLAHGGTPAPVVLVPCAVNCTGTSDSGCKWFFKDRSIVNLANFPNSQCLTAPLIAPRTCDSSSNSHLLPFCDTSVKTSARVADLVHRMNTSAKVDLVGHAGIPTEFDTRLNLKSFMWDMTCTHGVATLPNGYYLDAPAVTVPPVPLALAASFDADLVGQVAGITANEARVVSAIRYIESGGTDTWAQVCNGGPVGNIARDPRWGRLSETFGEDPFLAGTLALASVQGLQTPNVTNPFLATAAVVGRMVGFSGPLNEESFDAVIDDRTLADSYMPPFETAVVGGAPAGVMMSYNELNGVPNAANAGLMVSKLRVDWGSQAYTVSDNGAVEGVYTQHKYTQSASAAVVDAVNAGLDSMFTSTTDASQLLSAALTSDKVSVEQLDEMATRMLTTRMLLGEFDPAQSNSYATIPVTTLNSQAHRTVARNAASASIVLLKNKRNLLPLDTGNGVTVAVIGPNARNHATAYGHNLFLHEGNGFQPNVVDIVDGINNVPQVQTSYAPGCIVDISSSSTTDHCFCCQPSQPGFADAVAAAQSAAVAVAVVGTYAGIEGNGVDRSSLLLPGVQADLIRAVAATGTPLVIVMVNGGPLLLADETGDVSHLASAIVEAWFGGEEAGNGVADVLFGAVNPSGRLPVTFYDGVAQLPAFDDYSMTATPGRTYRYLEPATKPVYMFGYGLSYTTFLYSQLSVKPSNPGPCDNVFVVVNVTNTGKVAGRAVVQVYVSVPQQASTPTPRLSLQAVEGTPLGAGDSSILTIKLTPVQWTTVLNNGTRAVSVGNYTVHVGGHQPGDTLGAAESNTVAGSFEVMGPAAVVQGVQGFVVPVQCEHE